MRLRACCVYLILTMRGSVTRALPEGSSSNAGSVTVGPVECYGLDPLLGKWAPRPPPADV